MKIASIDIGTNTLLMLVAEVTAQNLEIIEDHHLIARLGEKVDKTGLISDEAIQRAIKILQEYKSIIKKQNIKDIVIVGTSALRDAINKEEVCNAFEAIIGTKVQIIAGEEEAKLSFLGSIIDDTPNIVIDIGGGSTEIISGISENINYKRSLEIGAVRLTERFLIDGGNSTENINKLNQFIKSELNKLDKKLLTGKVVAVAGTPTSLAQMNLNLEEYDYNKIHKYIFELEDLKRNIEILITTPKDLLVKNYHIHPNRADILLAGSLILQNFIEYLALDNFYVSCHGLRYGVTLDYFHSLKVFKC